jgi:hypothetical protein
VRTTQLGLDPHRPICAHPLAFSPQRQIASRILVRQPRRAGAGHRAAAGSGHSSIWIHPTIPLQFNFLGNREPRLNRAWVEELMQLANTPAGLRLTPEPAEANAAPRA